MYVYSLWLQTDASSEQIEAFAEELGHPAGTEEDKHGGARVLGRSLPLSRKNETSWEATSTAGSQFVGVAELPLGSVGGRLVGIVAAAQSLTGDVFGELADVLHQAGAPHVPVTFSLRSLFETPGVEPRSVRLVGDEARWLVQSDDPAVLRDRVAEINEEFAGVTVQAGDQRIAVMESGSVVFVGDVSLRDVLTAMQSIGSAIDLRESVAT